MNRRSAIAGLFSGAFASAEAIAQSKGNNAPVTPRENLKITKLETVLVKPRWLFLKVHTNAGIVGLGEPITEGRALTCARRSRRSSRTWSAKTRARSPITGRRSTGTPSIAGAPF